MTEPSPPPQTDTQHAIRSLARLARMLERMMPARLTMADFRMLSAIGDGEARASRLAHRLAVGKPTVSATVDSLVKRGLVTRTAHGADQRAIDLALTIDGVTVLADADAALGNALDRIAAETPDADATLRALAQLGPALDTLLAARDARLAGGAHAAASRPGAAG
ncbi:MAG TPA: MarR family winged helix-turn-helix transcriptional regulator [Microbacterium sp.]|uniref:MarR family winged helix-turn-helix transcriptional regulator n=1 Tax=Microbacterium sp. TaxID=51671 RepID=UPI002B4A874F|nr:MarR family winged helix-turn-helix transcriptional regulator [Microbacterium sp.]HKT57726.1 MarR family winged helix-turn-helix transcriptional regulator [Microbacterium sp.]